MHHIALEMQSRSRMEDLMTQAERHRRSSPRTPRAALRTRAGRLLIRAGASLVDDLDSFGIRARRNVRAVSASWPAKPC